MRLVFLGRGSAFNVNEGNTSAYVIDGRKLFLLDCGETVFGQLMKRGILENVDSVDIAISHLHSDHCGSLATLIFYCFFMLNIKVSLVLPDERVPAYTKEISQFLKLGGVYESYYSILDDHQVKGFNAFSAFRYIETRHDPDMHCFSFAFETPAGGLFYSADTNQTDELCDFLKTHPEPEAIYVETIEMDFPGNIHLPLSKLAYTVSGPLRQRTWLMHFYGNECVQLGKALGFQIVSTES